MKPLFQIQNLHLTFSVIIVFPIALIYGFLPQKIVPNPFDFQIISTDLATILKAIMGLYVAFALLWLLGIYNQKFWVTATISNALFMLGLGFGRVISCVIDGFPSPIFSMGMIGELILGFYATWVYFRTSQLQQNY